MGYYKETYWLSEGQGQTRAERKSGAYRYFIPTALNALHVQIDTDVVADIVKAEKALQEMNGYRGHLQNIDGLSRFLLRAEAISSSYIEGLQMGAKRLMQAELNETEPNTFKADPATAEIVGNIQALHDALDHALESPKIILEDIISIHKALLDQTPLSRYAGKLREEQNWIGGNSYNPLNATHIPPAPQYVQELMDDLIVYCNRDDVSPVQQVALAHAQFETIHPFVDGNGRTGRALIHLILRRRGLLDSFVPPISLMLATYSKSYIKGLNSIKFEGEQPQEQALDAINEWVSFFAGSCARACNEIVEFAEVASSYEQEWRLRLGQVRKNSSLDLLLGRLIGLPVFTVASATRVVNRSYQGVNLAVEKLVEVGIAKPLRSGKRNRAFEVTDALDAFRAFERKLASPAGDTRSAKPVRPVPYKGN